MHPITDIEQGSRLSRLAAIAYRRRRSVLLIWVVALVAALGLGSKVAGEFTADYATPGSESKAAADRIAERFPETSTLSVDVVWQAADAKAPKVKKRVDGFLAAASQLEGIGGGVDANQATVSDNGQVATVRLPLSTERTDDVPEETGSELIRLAEATSSENLRIELGGLIIAQAQQSETSSEKIGLLVAALVLLLTFGTLIAAGLPLATALFGLGISSVLVGALAGLTDVPDWAPSVSTMIGIGVGIDYALLILTRFRSALMKSGDPEAATVEAISTAGRSVLIAGTTVIISLFGLFLMGLTYLYGVALAAIVAVLVVMAASVTLLPALLGFARGRVDRLRVPGVSIGGESGNSAAASWAGVVQRRPWSALITGMAVVIILTAPLTGLRLGFPDAGNNGEETTTRQAYDLTAQAFGAGATGPLQVVVAMDGPEDRAGLTKLSRELKVEPGIASVQPALINEAGDTALFGVVPTTSPQSPQTAQLIERLRADLNPAQGLELMIGGSTAAYIDQSEATEARLPLFIGGVIGLSFLLLLGTFRAPVLALKAGLFNLISIGAAYGVMAAVAEGGAIGQLVGIDTATPVPPFIPVIMFAILFGLSMDYEVFLLSRIREAYLSGMSTSYAVTEGLSRTARVITAAAAIMIAVFGAFVFSEEVFLKLIGVGLASAVLIDATVIRMVLVPATMQLLGERSWWLPARLIKGRDEVPPASIPLSLRPAPTVAPVASQPGSERQTVMATSANQEI